MQSARVCELSLRWLGLGAPVAAESGPDAREREQRPIFIQREPHYVRGGSGAYSAKLLAGTRQRFSGFSQPRQCGDDVLRMLVTGGPPVRGGGGMPQRIVTISVPASVLRITGAG